MLLRNRNFDLFDEMFRDPFFNFDGDHNASQIMKADVQENENAYLLDLELPGYTKDNVAAELKDGYLTITANKTENKDEKDEQGRYIRKERYTGTCKRSFYVGEDVKQEDIKAAFKDGVLKLMVPKTPEIKQDETPKLITIE